MNKFQLLNIWAWIVAFAIGFAVVYGLNIPETGVWNIYENVDTRMSRTASAIYGGFYKVAWALAVGWVIFACSRGYGGWINELLSWKAFVPLSRVSYIIYLIHMDTMVFFFGLYESSIPGNVTITVCPKIHYISTNVCTLKLTTFLGYHVPCSNGILYIDFNGLVCIC